MLSELIGLVVGIGIAIVGSRWSYARTLTRYAMDGLGVAKRFGFDDEIPEWALKAAEQAIIAANHAEMSALVDKLVKRWKEAPERERAALERGIALHKEYGFVTEMIEPTGDEPTHKPFKDI